MVDFPGTPPPSGPHTPSLYPMDDAPLHYATPDSLFSTPLKPVTALPAIPDILTQAIVDADTHLKRLQQDLLILTGFNDNETLHWRPSWFPQEPFNANFWTLYNPPNVVTELLPHKPLGRLVYTRRMRRPEDRLPAYIETWDQWHRVCKLRGIPPDFLCEKQIELMRLGLPRDTRGRLCAPPSYPLYPEPQPLSRGRYILTPSTYKSHLPTKFHNLCTSAPDIEDVEIVVVYSDGSLIVEPREIFFMHASQWTLFGGHGGYVEDDSYVPDMNAPKDQARGRRWSWVPWTREMEMSCKKSLVVKLKVRVRGGNSA